MFVKNHTLILWGALFLIINGCGGNARQNSNAEKKLKGRPKLVFEMEMYNFGAIKEGDIVGKYIHFKNEGTNALIINKVITSCGCLDVKYPKKPVMPGKKGSLEVIFDTNGFHGRQVKFLKIFSNDSSLTEKELMIYATVQ